MNVEGGTWNDHFISTPKLVLIIIMAISLILIILTLVDRSAKITAWVIYFALYIFIAQFIIRYFIFEERFYYKMYQKLKECEIATPAVFWDIASIKDEEGGAILTYSDTKVGILVRLERDTITGKSVDFKETHYDAISDFYRDLMQNKYNFVQMNIMEQAGNDPRLESLDVLVNKSSNGNIRELMEREIGYIKQITRNSLYESDYILVYTTDLQKADNIKYDVLESIEKIMDGAFIGYSILSARDIIDFVKEIYGVKYFNYTEATLEMYKLEGIKTAPPFSIYEIRYSDGKHQKLTNAEINQVRNITSGVIKGSINEDDISIKQALERKENKNKLGVDFESIAEGVSVQGNKRHGKNVPGHKPQPKNSRISTAQPVDDYQEQLYDEYNTDYTEFSIEDNNYTEEYAIPKEQVPRYGQSNTRDRVKLSLEKSSDNTDYANQQSDEILDFGDENSSLDNEILDFGDSEKGSAENNEEFLDFGDSTEDNDSVVNIEETSYIDDGDDIISSDDEFANFQFSNSGDSDELIDFGD